MAARALAMVVAALPLAMVVAALAPALVAALALALALVVAGPDHLGGLTAPALAPAHVAVAV